MVYDCRQVCAAFCSFSLYARISQSQEECSFAGILAFPSEKPCVFDRDTLKLIEIWLKLVETSPDNPYLLN